MRSIIEKYWIYWALFIGALLVLLQSPLSPLGNRITETDTSVYLYCAQQILDGKIMYRDVFDHKGPFLYLIYIIGLNIMGGNTTGIWFMELISVFTSVVFIYKVVLLFYNKFVSFLSAFYTLLLVLVLYCGGNPELYAISFISISMFYFLRYFKLKEFRIKDFIVITLCFLCTLLLKPNFVVVWGIGGLLVLFDLISRKKKRDLMIITTIILTASLLLLLPFLFYLTANKSLNDFIFSYWSFNKAYSDINILAMINRTWDRLWFSGLNGYNNVNIFIFVYIISIVVYWNRVHHKLIHLFIGSVMLITGFSLSLSERSESYYLLLFVPSLGFCFGFIYNFLYNALKTNRKVYLILLFFFLNYGAIKSIPAHIKTPFKDKLTFKNEIGLVKKCTTPTDRIAVVGNDCSIYTFSERKSASKYVYISPIANIKLYGMKIQNEYCDDIERNTPKLIIKSNSFDRVDIPRLDSILNIDYSMVETYNNHEYWLRNKK